MKHMLNDMMKCLDNEQYHAALAVALMIPDICGNVEFPELKNNVTERYTKWFGIYAAEFFTANAECIPGGKIVPYKWLDAKTCYSLRCYYLHSGSVSADNISLTIHVHEKDDLFVRTHMVIDSKFVHLDLIMFCNQMYKAAMNYYENNISKFTLREISVVNHSKVFK